ncbi:hypothetical protein [Mesorhizobium sp. M0965]|uniref:hypothetical protein n=2 Tax=Mesorhizobium TaxID=68287 RepID=UPI003339BFD2
MQASQLGVQLFGSVGIQVALEIGRDLLSRAVTAIALDLGLRGLLNMFEHLALGIGFSVGFGPHDRIEGFADNEFDEFLLGVSHACSPSKKACVGLERFRGNAEPLNLFVLTQFRTENRSTLFLELLCN